MTRDDLLALMQWNSIYTPDWNDNAWAYVDAGLVRPNKSRRLGRLREPSRRFQAYLGVQYSDPPAIWSRGQAYCRFFVSLWVGRRVVTLQTHPTMDAALEQLWSFYERLPEVAARE